MEIAAQNTPVNERVRKCPKKLLADLVDDIQQPWFLDRLWSKISRLPTVQTPSTTSGNFVSNFRIAVNDFLGFLSMPNPSVCAQTSLVFWIMLTEGLDDIVLTIFLQSGN